MVQRSETWFILHRHGQPKQPNEVIARHNNKKMHRTTPPREEKREWSNVFSLGANNNKTATQQILQLHVRATADNTARNIH